MSVTNLGADQEAELAKMEEQAMRELEADGTTTPIKPEEDNSSDNQNKGDGESETPDPASTTGEETTTTKPDGEADKSGDKSSDASDEQATQPDGEEEEKSQPSEKAEKRFRDLAEQVKILKQQNEALQKSQTARPVKSETESTKKTNLPWNEEGETTVTPEQFEEQVQARAKQVVDQQRVTDARINQVVFDRIDLESSYPELRPDTEEYNQDLVDFISEGFVERLKTNPDLRLKDYAGKILEISRKSAEQAKAKSVANQQRIASTQPITSGGAQKPVKNSVESQIANAQSLEELEKIGSSLPQA